ncbi:four helix bundle protein [Sphingobacterium wenxiniae]|uniref:Four helix bundle protein n=1 Tax=Sphingobacterium wenxiniae TaxID=683125 RepID=A0A1I6RAG8_9SPHI|nr:four helix bundle protein [Sphingobacterium wenxiniae]SFS61540.1 four helix bundle protein [Sphingobacterium wenxiniae]
MKHNFKNLKIWVLAMEVASHIHKLCLEFPKTEQYGLISQMNRAAVSIPSNIAEGSNRGITHFRHFLNIALGSSFELGTQLLIANQNNYISEIKTNEIENRIIELQKMISGFIKKLGE